MSNENERDASTSTRKGKILILVFVLMLMFVSRLASLAKTRLLSCDDGNANGNASRKYYFISFVLLRDHFNSFNFYTNGELPRKQIGRGDARVKKENEKFTVVWSRSPQNLEFSHFTLLFCRGRQRNVPKLKRAIKAIVSTQ